MRYNLDDINRLLTTVKRKTCIVEMEKGKGNSWDITLDVEVEIMLPDGRVVSAWQEVKVKGKMSGKKRAPAQKALFGNDYQHTGE